MSEDEEWMELEAVQSWLNEHGWDQFDSVEFNQWLKESGIDKSKLTIFVGRIPEGI